MNKLCALLFFISFNSFAQQMEFKVVSPQGNVSSNRFPTLDACQSAIRSFASGSICTPFPKDSEQSTSSQKQMEFKVVSPQGNVSSNRFPTMDACQSAIRSFASGSKCTPFPKD